MLKLFFDVLRPGLFSECEAAASSTHTQQHMCAVEALKRLAFSYISNNFSKASPSYTIFHPISGQLEEGKKPRRKRKASKSFNLENMGEGGTTLYFYTALSSKKTSQDLFTICFFTEELLVPNKCPVCPTVASSASTIVITIATTIVGAQ